MNALRRIQEWLKYDRLHYYPALAAFDRDSALKRLEAYEREERQALEPWFTTVWVLMVAFALLWGVLECLDAAWRSLDFAIQLPAWALYYWM